MARVLLVIPHDRFRDEEFEAVYNRLRQEGHEINIGSSHHTEAQGHFGLLVKPDVNVSFVEATDYDAIIFIGGRGIDEYISNIGITSLLRNMYTEGKILAALGRAVEILALSGVISGHKITCDVSSISKVQTTGGYYTGSLVVEDRNIITGTGVDARLDFAETLAENLSESGTRGGLYARTARS